MKNKQKLGVVATIVAIILVGFLGMIFMSKYLSQSNQISELNNQVSELEKTQLPKKQFASYEDCNANQGVMMNTINAQFSACLGGSQDKFGELPQPQAFLQYSAQNLPRLEENKVNKSGKNKLVAASPASASLTQFLENSYTGCEIGSSDNSKFSPGYFKLKKEVQNRFALVGYECSDGKALDNTFSIAINLADGWRWISTTNNINDKGQPSCLVVDLFKISKDLAPKCFENTGFNNGKLKDVTYP